MRGLRRFVLLGVVLAAVEGRHMRIAAQSSSGVSPTFYAELAWRCIGPFDGGPVASVEGIAGQPGIYTITTPAGGAWKTNDGGDTWTAIDRPSIVPTAPDPARWVDPANPKRIVRTDARGIAVSLDTGKTWHDVHNLPIADVAVLTGHQRPLTSIADPVRAGLKFSATSTGVTVSFDAGAHWQSLQLNMPSVAINDLEIRGNNLIAATKGRSTWMLEDISPLRQLTAAMTAATLTLFKPADAIATSDVVFLDYLIRGASRGSTDVRLEVLDASGRVVHAVTSAAPDRSDRWLPVSRPLSAAPGHHRVAWNLRFDPPPSPDHKYAQAAPSIFLEIPPEPDGPRVIAGTYRVRLTSGAVSQVQPLVVRNDPKTPAADVQMARQKFQLAMKSYDAMQMSHRAFLQTTRLRDRLRPLLLSTDLSIVIAATNLYIRVASLDGSDWTGLVIPDYEDEGPEIEEELLAVKHPDFVPPKPVSVSKDYDDPASILGRVFENVNHPPALLILNGSIGELLMKTAAAHVAPDSLTIDTYENSCQELGGVLDSWRAINTQELPAFNAELAKRKLPPLPIATAVPALRCGGAR